MNSRNTCKRAVSITVPVGSNLLSTETNIHLIKRNFINNGIDAVNLSSIVRSKSVTETVSTYFTLPFIIPRTVLLSSTQPEAETLDFSTHALPRNLLRIFPPREYKQRQRCQQSVVMSRAIDLKRFCFNPKCSYFCNTV